MFVYIKKNYCPVMNPGKDTLYFIIYYSFAYFQFLLLKEKKKKKSSNLNKWLFEKKTLKKYVSCSVMNLGKDIFNILLLLICIASLPSPLFFLFRSPGSMRGEAKCDNAFVHFWLRSPTLSDICDVQWRHWRCRNRNSGTQIGWRQIPKIVGIADVTQLTTQVGGCYFWIDYRQNNVYA